MTHEDQYIPFVIARLFGGFFGGNATALGADTILDLFFLHQRGRGLTVLNLSFLGGVVVGPTLSGFIVGNAPWTVQFWWSNGLEAIVIVLSLLFLEDTYYNRSPNARDQRHARPDTLLAKRKATFLCHPRKVPPVSFAESFGYLMHPAIDLPTDKSDIRIADVGTGTGIWLAELTKELPHHAVLDGFDISDEQYPPQEWYGENVSLSTLDIFKPVPERLVGSWINNLPSHFQQAGLKILAHVAEPPLPIYRKPWNEDNLMGWAPIADRIEDEEERSWFRDLHAKAATDAAKGWYVNWKLIVCVGRKPVN
ncbi:MAG: hypothetical protein Q9213_002165 [Squamulea squamosa]